MTGRFPKVDALKLASIVQGFEPRGISIELVAEDRIGIREQLALYMMHVLVDEFGMGEEEAELFFGSATSHLVAERVVDVGSRVVERVTADGMGGS